MRISDWSSDVCSSDLVAAHLGAGASICALEGGVSCDTTMGFSTLDGVPMATRCGATDPGVLLHLMRARDMSADALEHMLYHESGLLGLSGISGDRSEEHTSELQSLMRISYAASCLNTKQT